ncbi:orotate phosphoribosyltransferase-like protein [Methanobrevibacter curvatus]|uniref:Transcriptional regulator GfcR n=1 Tax=Methanobrevibacter curvatus TaxID=49547 RepID=A0A166CIS9_9EURY|nr:orotate phosphoribosyltransferase-like protein [Methanobrevibacter curvatus]KZX14553.1 orotate phosphoribosyltransferase [Methanobrevibacter curvatus]
MNQKLIKKAHDLRNRGFTTGEIADQLNVSMDTVRWLTIQKISDETHENAPLDVAINLNRLGGSSSRLRYVAAALSDMTLEHGDADVVVGIAISGIPFATMMADFLQFEEGIQSSLAVFHPIKHRKGEEEQDNKNGTFSENFACVQGKRAIIVDDVITSGRTIKDVIAELNKFGATPVCVAVLIDKKGINEIEGVPVESLIHVNRLD